MTRTASPCGTDGEQPHENGAPRVCGGSPGETGGLRAAGDRLPTMAPRAGTAGRVRAALARLTFGQAPYPPHVRLSGVPLWLGVRAVRHAGSERRLRGVAAAEPLSRRAPARHDARILRHRLGDATLSEVQRWRAVARSAAGGAEVGVNPGGEFQRVGQPQEESDDRVVFALGQRLSELGVEGCD